MATRQASTDGVDQLLNRLSKATIQITRASEKQAREADKQVKRLLDRGEASTERLIKAIGKEMQSQISGLRRELRDVERRVGELRTSVTKQSGSKQAPAKQTVARKPTVKKAVKKAAKKAPAKKKVSTTA